MPIDSLFQLFIDIVGPRIIDMLLGLYNSLNLV